MKNSTKIASGLVLTLVAGSAAAAISATKHNMGSGSGGNEFGGTTEICVFCHTPHGSTTANTEAPLWNRELTDSTSYVLYGTLGTATLDGGELQVGSVSIACLSCHDGLQALNSVVNSPGSGVKIASQGGDGTMTSAALPGAVANTNGLADTTGWSEFSNFESGALLEGDKFFWLGTDLTNDHPIGIQYAGGGISTGTATHVDDSFNAASVGVVGANTRYWVDTDGTAGRSKNDLPLFERGAGGADAVYVECASCHDPHTGTDLFLRHALGNAGSATCLTCHDK